MSSPSSATYYLTNDSPSSSRSASPCPEIYSLPQPVEDCEKERLNYQHEVFRMMLGGLYPNQKTVRKILAPKPGVQRAILDLGSGSGSWAVAMAYEFPHAEVVGLDRAPHIPSNTPKNCRFEIADFNDGHSHLKGRFDLIHARCLGSGFNDYQVGLNYMLEYLRPGGCLILGEGTLKVFSEDKSELPPSASAWSRMLAEYFEFNADQGNPIDWHDNIEFWLDEESRNGEHELHVSRRDYYSPIGWSGLDEDGYQEGARIGYLTGKNCQAFSRALTTCLLARGFDQDAIDEWIEEVDDELLSSKTRMYLKWQFLSVVKTT